MIHESPKRAREPIDPVFESSWPLPHQDLLLGRAAIPEQDSSLGARRVPRPCHITRPGDRRYRTPAAQYLGEHILRHHDIEHALHVDVEVPGNGVRDGSQRSYATALLEEATTGIEPVWTALQAAA